jgi:serine/threonine-protein kinase
VPQTDPTSRAILRLGTSLQGRYTLLRLIRVSARAAVYEGRTPDGRRVAVEWLTGDGADDAAAHGDRAIAPLDQGQAEDGARFIVTPLVEWAAPDDGTSAQGTKVSGAGEEPRAESVETAPPSGASGADATRARVGTVLADKYRVEALIGEGGTAAVYRAVHRNGHRVAVKVLHPRLAVERAVRDRFLREGYVANKIEHPGVARVLDDCVLADGTAFLVMELLDGQALDERAKQGGGALSQAEVVRLALELLDVLAAAHVRGIVHRDVKPGNLLVTEDGGLKVLDFGLARAPGPEPVSRTRTGAVMGTPAFMAPEQALGQTREVDAQTDVWAVGATIWNLLTGQYVHPAPTAEAMRVYAGSRPASPLARVAPSVNPGLAAVVDRALAFDKRNRWPSAAAMADALRALDPECLQAMLADAREGAPRGADEVGVSTAALIAATRGSAAKRGGAAIALLGVVAFALLSATLLIVRRSPTTSVQSIPSAAVSVALAVPSAPSEPTIVAEPERPGLTREAPSDAANAASARPPERRLGRAYPPRAAASEPLAVTPPSVPDPCALPYLTDGSGRRTYKPECLPGRQEPPIASAESPPPDSCEPPYVIDAAGRRVYKPACLAR